MTELTDFLIEEKTPALIKEEEEETIVQETQEPVEEQTLSSFLFEDVEEEPQAIEQKERSLRETVLKGFLGETVGGILNISPAKLIQKEFEVIGEIGSGIRIGTIKSLEVAANLALAITPEPIRKFQTELLEEIRGTEDLDFFEGGIKINLEDGIEIDFRDPAEELSEVEKAASLVTQLSIPGLGFTKILKGAGVAKKIGDALIKWGVNGRISVLFADLVNAELGFSVASQLVFDGNDPRLSNLVQQNPEFANAAVIGPLTEFLQADPDDSVLVGRTKLALEDALIGLGAGGLLSVVAELAPKVVPKLMTRVTGKLTPEQESFQEYLRTETKFYESEALLDEAFDLARIETNEEFLRLSEAGDLTPDFIDRNFNVLPIIEQEKIIAEILTTSPNLSETSTAFLASFFKEAPVKPTIFGKIELKDISKLKNTIRGSSIDSPSSSAIDPLIFPHVIKLKFNEFLDLAVPKNIKVTRGIGTVEQEAEGFKKKKLKKPISLKGNFTIQEFMNSAEVVKLETKLGIDLLEDVPVELTKKENLPFLKIDSNGNILEARGAEAVAALRNLETEKGFVEAVTERTRPSNLGTFTDPISVRIEIVQPLKRPAQVEELLFTTDDVLRLRREADANDQFFAFKSMEITELEQIEISTLARQALDKMDESIAGPKTLAEKTKELTERVLKEKRQFIQNMFDLYRPAKRQQETVTGFQASIVGLKKATEKVAAGGVIQGSVGSPSTLPYYSFRLLAATPQRVEDILLKGVALPPEVGAKFARFEITGNKGLDQILEPFESAGQLDTFLKYAGAKRAINLAARDKPIIVPLLEGAEVVVNELKRNKSFIKAEKELKQYTDDLLEYARRSDLLDEKTIKAFNKASPEVYIPLYRIVENVEGLKKVQAGGTPFKRIKGGDETINDLLDNLRRYTYSIVNASDLNRTRLNYFKFIEDAQASGTLSGVVKRLGNKQAVESFGAFTKDVLNQLEKNGLHIDIGDNDLSSVLNVMGFSSRIKTNRGTLVEFAREDGKLVAFEILDEDTAKMFGAMGPQFSKSALLKPFSRISGLFGAAITRDPRFFTFNILRDTISSPINSEFGFIPVYSTLKGLKDIYSDQELFREAIINGLGFSTRVITEGADVSLLKSSSKLLKTSYGRKMFNIVDKIGLKFALNTAKGYTKFVDSLELASRISEFQLAKKAGLDDIGAAFAGREITTDFGNRGASELLRSYSRYTVFLNAGLQGVYRAGRRIKENPKKLLGAVGVLVAFDLGQHVTNLNFKEYQQLDDRSKELNYLFPNFKDTGQALQWVQSGLDPQFLPELDEELPFIPIPKPFDYGQVGTFTIGLYDMIRTANPAYGPQAFTNFIQNIMPIRETMVPQAPTAVQPLLDLLINKNFRGKDITPIYMKSLEKTEQYFSSTSETAIAASRGLRDTFGFNDSPLSPIEIDFLLNGYMPGLLQIPKSILETKVRQEVKAPARARERKFQEIVRLDPKSFVGGLRDTPLEPIAVGTINFARRVVGRFTSINLDKQNAHINRLYEIKREVDKVVTSREKAISDVSRLLRLKRELDINGEDFSDVFSERDKQFLASQQVFSDFSATLLAGNELIRVIREREDMSPDQKRIQIDLIQSQNREIAFQLINQLQNMRDLDELFSGPFGVKKDTGENPFFEQMQKLLKEKE